jgi:uncharacterized protein
MHPTLTSLKEAFPNLNSLTLNITEACNLNCVYCYEQNKTDQAMTTDMMSHILTNLDLSKVGQINFFGGEPLLNWPVMKLCVDFCNENHITGKIGMTTNLTLLTDEVIDYIDEYNLLVMISMDGIKEVHDKYRSNSWDTVYANIKKLIDRGLGHLVQIRYTVYPESSHRLYEGIKNLMDMGLNNLCPMAVTDVPWTEEQYENFKQDHLKVIQLYIDTLATGRSVMIKDIEDLLYTILEPLPSEKVGCQLKPDTWISINSDGSVYPCHRCFTVDSPIVDDMKLGDIYNGIDLEQTKICHNKDLKLEQKCIECTVRFRCHLGCVMENIAINQEKYKPTDAHCKIAQILVNNVRDNREAILSDVNINNRRINALKENLKVKKYFDENIKGLASDPIEFCMKIDHFYDNYHNLEENNILISAFDDYFKSEMSLVTAFILAINGKRITEDLIVEDDPTLIESDEAV